MLQHAPFRMGPCTEGHRDSSRNYIRSLGQFGETCAVFSHPQTRVRVFGFLGLLWLLSAASWNSVMISVALPCVVSSITQCPIFFGAAVHGMAFVIRLSCLLLLCTNIVDFCVDFVFGILAGNAVLHRTFCRWRWAVWVNGAVYRWEQYFPSHWFCMAFFLNIIWWWW